MKKLSYIYHGKQQLLVESFSMSCNKCGSEETEIVNETFFGSPMTGVCVDWYLRCANCDEKEQVELG